MRQGGSNRGTAAESSRRASPTGDRRRLPRTHRLGLALPAALWVVASVAGVRPANAQSVLERPPNLDAGWVAPPGGVQFDFLHRFTVSSAPAHKVENSPTFLLGVGLPGRLMAGFNYATNSGVAPSYPNEWEFFGRWQPLSADIGGPLDATLQGGYNLAAKSLDGALGLGRPVGPLRLMAEARVLGDAYATGKTRAALGGGGTLHLGRWFALAGDAAKLLGTGPSKVAWGAGLQMAIPYTPHTLSLQVTNTSTGTLQGASIGSDTRRYGFAFTIPLSLGRYFGKVAAAAPAATSAAAQATPPPSGDTAAPATPATSAAPAATPAGAPAAAPPRPEAPDSSVAPSPATPAAAPAGGAPARRTPPTPAPRRAPASAGAKSAAIRNLAFMPGRVEVPVGGTVVWTNRDAVGHSITADDGSFDSGVIAPGATWRHSFAQAGTHGFHCTPHPFMHGQIVVR